MFPSKHLSSVAKERGIPAEESAKRERGDRKKKANTKRKGYLIVTIKVLIPLSASNLFRHSYLASFVWVNQVRKNGKGSLCSLSFHRHKD